MAPFRPRRRRSAIQAPRKSYACGLTSLRIGKSRTSTAGHIGDKAESPARRISTKRFSCWALRPCAIARRKALLRVGALLKPAVPGRKTCRSSTGLIDRHRLAKQKTRICATLCHKAFAFMLVDGVRKQLAGRQDVSFLVCLLQLDT